MLDHQTALEIAVPFLRNVESFRANAYQDGGGKWTIGYGHASDVTEGQKISQPKAQDLLLEDAERFAELISPQIPPDLNPNQFAALISFTFNVGPGLKGARDGFLILENGEPSTLLKYICANPRPDLKTIGDEFLRWIYIKGQPSSGLCSRRTAERRLFMTPYPPQTEMKVA